MVGTARFFLQYNVDNVLKHLLAIEAHLKDLPRDYRTEHASCIIKHLLQLEEQCEEGMSHAAELRRDEMVEIFRQLREKGRELKLKLVSRSISPEDAIRFVRELRRLAEKLAPEYDLARCATCAPSEETLEEIERAVREFMEALEEEEGEAREHDPTRVGERLLVLEEGYAREVVRRLSEEYGVPPPQLCFVPVEQAKAEGKDPAMFGRFEPPDRIVLCRSGASAHVIAHEFRHYLDHLRCREGDKRACELPEDEAEEFAIELARRGQRGAGPKCLKLQEGHEHGGGRMAAWREAGVIVGGEHVAKGLERAFWEIDIRTGRAAEPPHKRVSTWASLGVGVASIVAGAMGWVPYPWDLFLVSMGGHLTTEVWDIVEEYAARAKGAPAAALWAPVTAGPAKAPAKAPPKPTGLGKYAITG